MPALKKIHDVEYVGVGHASEEEWFGKISKSNNLKILESDFKKAESFQENYGGAVFDSFHAVIQSENVDAVYIPLPPALHFKWAKLALEHGKHVMVEKPSTTSAEQTKQLLELAKKGGLALHENYMFVFHSQLQYVKKVVETGELGEVRLFRISFGFPFRGGADFRYSKDLGGGALLDCGGYTIKLATYLLGPTSQLVAHKLNYKDGFDVDIYGSGTFTNKKGQVAQIAFGMDNEYKCDLEIWGSKGTLFTGRILTAPDGFEPIFQIKSGGAAKEIKLDSDDAFMKSINYFITCIEQKGVRLCAYDDILRQSLIVDEFEEI